MRSTWLKLQTSKEINHTIRGAKSVLPYSGSEPPQSPLCSVFVGACRLPGHVRKCHVPWNTIGSSVVVTPRRSQHGCIALLTFAALGTYFTQPVFFTQFYQDKKATVQYFGNVETILKRQMYLLNRRISVI